MVAFVAGVGIRGGRSGVSCCRMVAPSVPKVENVKNQAQFHEFFSQMSGKWNSQRNYHYLTDEDEEDMETSRMTFDVRRLTVEQKKEVLDMYDTVLDDSEISSCEGFEVSFKTMMENKGLKKSFTNLVFVPATAENDSLKGQYLRDFAYEERRPVPGEFEFNSLENKLVMTTRYSKVVSVDSIQLVNPETRLRQIINYKKPENKEDPLTTPVLAGFGIETKSNGESFVVE